MRLRVVLPPEPADLSFEHSKLLAQCQDFGAEPVVELNRAVAAAMARGLAAGLAIVEAIDAEGTLAGPAGTDSEVRDQGCAVQEARSRVRCRR